MVPDRVTDLYAIIDEHGQEIARIRQDRFITAQQRSDRVRTAQAIIVDCHAELRELRIGRMEATDCLNLPDGKKDVASSMLRMVEPHAVAEDGAPMLHHRLLAYLSISAGIGHLAERYPDLHQVFTMVATEGYKQVAVAHILGVSEATISDRYARARHLLAQWEHDTPDILLSV